MKIKRFKEKTLHELLENVENMMKEVIDDASKSDDPYVQYQLELLKKRFDKTMLTAEKVTKK